MLCSFCNYWFHLIRNCPDKNIMNTNYGSTDDIDPLDSNQPSDRVIDFGQMDRSLDEYNFTPVGEDEGGQHQKDVKDHIDTCFLSLAYNIEHEFYNPQNCYAHHSRPLIKPNPQELQQLHPTLRYDEHVPFHGLCFDEGAPHSVTGLNQWMAYLRSYHLPKTFREIDKKKMTIRIGGQGDNKVKVDAIGTVVIRIPLPADTFFDFNSLLISNDVPMLLGLSTQAKLKAITDKGPDHTHVYFKAIGIKLPLKFKFGHL